MPLIKQTLKAGLLTLMQDLSTAEDPAAAADQYADRMATLITDYIKTATVTVQTTGTAAAQAGTGTLS
jgi:hypothetical protein